MTLGIKGVCLSVFKSSCKPPYIVVTCNERLYTLSIVLIFRAKYMLIIIIRNKIFGKFDMYDSKSNKRLHFAFCMHASISLFICMAQFRFFALSQLRIYRPPPTPLSFDHFSFDHYQIIDNKI